MEKSFLKMMRIEYLDLPSVGLIQKDMSSDAEKALKNQNSLKKIRSAGKQYKSEVAESTQPVVDMQPDIMCRFEV